MEHLHRKPVVTCEEMKALEQAADAAGLSYTQMMENAGCKAAELILAHYDTKPRPEKVLILCGKGNNGGDGLVIARKFHEAGIPVKVLLVEGEPVTPDARLNYTRIKDDVPVLTAEASFLDGDEDLVIDAIYGTGFRGALRAQAENIIQTCNDAELYTAALDLPSGLSGDMVKCEQMRPCMRANLTITFHAKKPVHKHGQAAMMMGKIVVADIGITEILEKGK